MSLSKHRLEQIAEDVVTSRSRYGDKSTLQGEVTHSFGAISGRRFLCFICQKPRNSPTHFQRCLSELFTLTNHAKGIGATHFNLKRLRNGKCGSSTSPTFCVFCGARHRDRSSLSKCTSDCGMRILFSSHGFSGDMTDPDLKHFECLSCKRSCFTVPDAISHSQALNHSHVTCTLCMDSFELSDRYLLKWHNIKHLMTAQNTCFVCNKSFPSSAGLAPHIRATHNHEFCVACNYPFQSENHHHDMDKKCPFCPRYFKDDSRLLLHLDLDRCVAKPPYYCAVCAKDKGSLERLIEHRIRKHGHAFQCFICEKVFAMEHNIYIHMHEVHDSVYCIRSKQPLQGDNESWITNLNSFRQCLWCETTFSTYNGRQSHEESDFSCSKKCQFKQKLRKQVLQKLQKDESYTSSDETESEADVLKLGNEIKSDNTNYQILNGEDKSLEDILNLSAQVVSSNSLSVNVEELRYSKPDCRYFTPQKIKCPVCITNISSCALQFYEHLLVCPDIPSSLLQVMEGAKKLFDFEMNGRIIRKYTIDEILYLLSTHLVDNNFGELKVHEPDNVDKAYMVEQLKIDITDTLVHYKLKPAESNK